MAVNVQTTNVSRNLSRLDLLNWVNARLQCQFKKIEDLSTGAAYCQFLDLLFPGQVQMKRVKFGATQEYEFIHNFRIFQDVLHKLSVTKDIPVNKLVMGKFQDNFEFAQWFKMFFDVNYTPHIYDPIKARKGALLQCITDVNKTKPMKINTSSNSDRLDDRNQRKVDELIKELNALNVRTEALKLEKKFYKDKLMKVLEICEPVTESRAVAYGVLNILGDLRDKGDNQLSEGPEVTESSGDTAKDNQSGCSSETSNVPDARELVDHVEF